MELNTESYLSFRQKLELLSRESTLDMEKEKQKRLIGYQTEMVLSQLVQRLIMDQVLEGKLAPIADGGFKLSDKIVQGASIKVDVPTAAHLEVNDAHLQEIVKHILDAGKIECDVTVLNATITLKRPALRHELHQLAS